MAISPTALAASGEELSPSAIRGAVEALLSAEVPVEEKAEFLLALHRKGETPREIAGFVEVLLEHALTPSIDRAAVGRPLLDVCGTGGDRSGFFNVSTAAMFVCAGAGAGVVKHGNRSISSRCGGADVLEAMGVPLQVPASQAGDFLARCGFVFLFAPAYHPAFREVAPVRKLLAEQGHLTIFNILGPLLNPARPEYQLAGVFRRDLLQIYIEVFRLLGRRNAWAIHGTLPDGGALDEISSLGPTYCRTLDGAEEMVLDPAPLLREPNPRGEFFQGDSPAKNAELIEAILRGNSPNACTDLVCLNAGAGLAVCGLARNWEEGVNLAYKSLNSGAAAATLTAARSFGC